MGAVTAFHGGFNRSTQHTDHCVSRRSVANEVPDADLLHRQSEGVDVGALEARCDASPDSQAVRPGARVIDERPAPSLPARNLPLATGCSWPSLCENSLFAS